MNALQPVIPTMTPTAVEPPKRLNAALIAVAIINLLIGAWYAGSGAWTALMAPRIAYMGGHALAQSEPMLKEYAPLLQKSNTPMPDFAALSQQIQGSMDWMGFYALAWYTLGLALVIVSIAMLCGGAWARTGSLIACLAGACIHSWSIGASLLVSTPIELAAAQQVAAVAKYAAFVTNGAFLAYFTLAVAVLWNARSRIGAAKLRGLRLPSLPQAAPEPMGFPGANRTS